MSRRSDRSPSPIHLAGLFQAYRVLSRASATTKGAELRRRAGRLPSFRRRLLRLSRQRASYSRLQELQHVDAHRNGDVGMVVNRCQERHDSNVALYEDIYASRVESLLLLHAQASLAQMRRVRVSEIVLAGLRAACP
jgi:hypothetical protein